MVFMHDPVCRKRSGRVAMADEKAEYMTKCIKKIDGTVIGEHDLPLG
jgi:hypothetical protein